MKFTGERFMTSETGRIRLEHYHRYTILDNSVVSRKVLDVACGEGYGSYLLANAASSVTGVDISNESVAHAREKYIKDNLNYIQASATDLPFEDDCFDVVVSFETIEHLHEQEMMIKEIRRVLKDDGVLIISSPNRPVYSEASGEYNEFHVRELDYLEFDALLRPYFGKLKYYGQRLQIASVIQSLNDKPETCLIYSDDGVQISHGAPGVIDPMYFLCVCGNQNTSMPDLAMSALYPSNFDLISHYVDFAKWAKKQDEAVIIRDQQIMDLIEVARGREDLQQALNKAAIDREKIQLALNEIINSNSWIITQPLRFFGALVRNLTSLNNVRGLFIKIRPLWRRLPVPLILRKKVSEHFRRLLAVRPATQVLPVATSLAAQGSHDYFCFSVIDWHFRHQRPQQLALQIAGNGRRVFYISVDFVNSCEPGFTVEPLDTDGRLFNVHLYLNGAPSIYGKPPTTDQLVQLRQSIGRLLEWTNSTSVVSLIQHSFWSELAAQMPNSRLVYDCMDHHEGFGGVSDEMIAHERALLAAADLTVTTSLWLDNEVADKTSRHVLIRNATEFDHFAKTPVDIYKEPLGRRVIGYYGAIAEWFDVDLMAQVAQAFPECAVVLIGADTIGAQKKLAGCKNVSFLGEIPYKELPRYAHAFDVCLLPFKVIPLTLATNPVKVYEYLSMGKPVVSTGLPEVREMGSVCAVGNDASEFVSLVRKCLDLPGDASERQAFAKAQTWAHRATALIDVSEDHKHDPLVSVIVVTYNNLDLTKQCLASLDAYSDYANMEVIVVDNASSDGSPEWLQQWGATEGHNRKLILNADNRGFAAGNNLGLAIASGEYLVMLNNDTHVTPGWVRTMVNHMRRNPDLGLLGPVTNNIGNEARIDIFYDGMTQMMARSSQYTRSHVGQLYPLRTAAFFCVMLKRSVFEKIGPLDEAFGRGFFEDDDYCRRIEQAGLKVACAEDVFVHHHLSASFNKLKSQDRQQLFEDNRKVYEAKWGPWIPHEFRPPAI